MALGVYLESARRIERLCAILTALFVCGAVGTTVASAIVPTVPTIRNAHEIFVTRPNVWTPSLTPSEGEAVRFDHLHWHGWGGRRPLATGVVHVCPEMTPTRHCRSSATRIAVSHLRFAALDVAVRFAYCTLEILSGPTGTALLLPYTGALTFDAPCTRL
jgi:hypothetical protein